MEFTEVKDSFLRTLVTNGFTSIEEVPENLTLGVPRTLLGKWIDQFKNAPSITAVPSSPRLINRFTLGADPEFTFFSGGGRIPAMKTGLQTGLAFGMDMNGRLVELRPTPSRFALDIVASILAELRWMATIHPEVCEFQWHAMPFDGADGVGGHVHLARKHSKEKRRYDVQILAKLYYILHKLGVFNQAFCDQRTSHTKYGQTNDFRLQKHGYEYRAFPTWLDSPWLAHFVLTISKLAIFDQELLDDIYLTVFRTPKFLERAIFNFISYYKNTDDDAWIAFHALKKFGLPKQLCNDFRTCWGIVYPRVQGAKADSRFYPTMIEPTDNERNAVFQFIVNQYPIKPERPICNWQPERLPLNYNWVMNYTTTYHKIGIGEIAAELVTHKSLSIYLDADEDKNRISVQLPKTIDCHQGLNALVRLAPRVTLSISPGEDGCIHIWLPQILRSNEYIPLVKRVLTSGLFPVWNVRDIKENYFEDWVKKNSSQPEKKLVGKELV